MVSIVSENKLEDMFLESIRQKVTVDDVANVLSLMDDRAQALLDGVIRFEASEVYLLAVNKGINYLEFIGIEE